MRVVNGMHVGNTRHWHVEDMLRTDGGRGAMTILHHLMFPRDAMADQWGDVENAYWYHKLRHGWPAQGIAPAPERLIHVRLYHPAWKSLDPKAWARHAVTMLSDWRFEGLRANLWDDPLVCVSPANEQDIEGYGPGGAATTAGEYDAIGRWNLAFWDEVDRLIPGRRALSCWSALAGGHDAYPDDPDSEYAVPAIRDAIQRCDVGAVHLYGHMEWGAQGDKTLPGGVDDVWHMLRAWRPKGWRDTHQPSVPGRPRDRGGFCAQFPGKPFIVSEAGTFAHHDRGRTAQTFSAMKGLLAKAASDPACLGVTWFIWSTDEAHPTNNIMANPELRDALTRAPAFETTARVPSRTPAPAPPAPPPAPPPVAPPVTLPAVVSAGVAAMGVPREGEGWALFAGRMHGHPAASYGLRLAWAVEVLAANGIAATASAVHAGQVAAPTTRGAWRSPWHRPEVTL